MAREKKKGDFGENLAKEYLEKKQFFILEEKYYARMGEVDIIAWDKNMQELVFVEVKTRMSREFGWPEESVDRKKKKRWKESARSYLFLKYKERIPKYRFDVISIIVDKVNRKAQIYHFKNIDIN